MDRKLNREILRLALPSILANITVPLVGIVDTAIAGHLDAGAGAASYIAAISVGSMLFTLMYWNFSFLRSGTGGLTAQAYGAQDETNIAKIFWRSILLALAFALLLLLFQRPFMKLGLLCTDASQTVESLAARYFSIRIWAAPATLSLMAFSGWFVGMQDSMASMWKDLIINGVNIAASLIFSFGLGSWKGIGFEGIALGTAVAQYSGLAFCITVCLVKYRGVLSRIGRKALRELLSPKEIGPFMKMNGDLLVRSVSMTAVYIGFTLIATGFGDLYLACSSIMMELLMLFSYFTDGFAYAGEALSGRFIGARDRANLLLSVKYVFVWSMAIAVLFIGVYWVSGIPLLKVMTSDMAVVEACRTYLPWLGLMPILGCAAFTWDGIFLGATCSVQLRDSMLYSVVAFLGTWFLSSLLYTHITGNPLTGAPALHYLFLAYFAHLVVRTIWLSASWPRLRDAEL